MLSEEALELFIHETALVLKEKQKECKPEAKTQKRRLEAAEGQIANIMNAIKQGIITPSTKAALQKAEAEYAEIKAELQENAQASEVLTAFLPRAAERYKALVMGLREALQTDISRARQHLKALMGQIRLLPSAKGYLEAELRYNSENLLELALGVTFKARVVAGAGLVLTK